MKIAVIGRGNVGGGLADLWEKAGHEVTRIGKEGGDVSVAEAVLVAVPGGAIEAALDNVQGLEGKTTIDATNLFGADRPSGFQSNAQFVKSRTNGPTAKSSADLRRHLETGRPVRLPNGASGRALGPNQ
jgi:predicted dinucleotide-binding enzyme